MIKSYCDIWKNFVNFKDRTTRKDYWLGTIATIISDILLLCIFVLLFSIEDTHHVGSMLYLVIFYIFLTVMYIPNTALAVRRLHDINLSGWLYFINFIPFGGIVIFILMLLPSKDTNNKYGKVL